ncbi:ribokinase [Paenibacillus sp. y28]|uniref:ribokinase n=1 Tax=Paenibacillus sp. y28 TaxID=3129110 RepID=UPI003016F655
MSQKAKIAVVGSINMDLVATVTRSPVPGETISGQHFAMISGGKGANQAVAAARLGAEVTMIGCVGDDLFGVQLTAQLRQEGIDTQYIRTAAGQSTGVALIQVQQEGGNSIVVVAGANGEVTPEQVEEAEAAIRSADVLLLQLEIPLPAVQKAAEIARRHGVRTILNPAPAVPLPEELLQSVDLLTPNETEAAILTTGEARFDGGITDLIGALKRMAGGTDVLITHGELGAFYQIGDTAGHQPAYNVKAVDTTAAGDCFNAGIAVRWGEGAELPQAFQFASKAAALAVTRFGAQTSLPVRTEVERFTGE